MQVTVIGSGDAFGSGGRFSTCLHLTTASGANILVDCGAGSMTALNRAGIDRNAIQAILFTHFHGDHFGALPAFLLDALFSVRRRTPLLIAGPKRVAEWARAAMEAAFPGASGNAYPFEITYREISPHAADEVAGIAVTAFPMVHDPRAGPCQGYRLSADGKVFAYSGDSAWTDALVPLAAGADALLLECYTYDIPLKNHLDWKTLEQRLPELASKRIVLTHMGPQMLAHRDQVPLECAEDGMVIEP
jgi:ribonuclease BN (tRNA processing enzyme)